MLGAGLAVDVQGCPNGTGSVVWDGGFRTGCGKMQHTDGECSFLQDVVRKRRMGINKLDVKRDPTDLMTKYVGRRDEKSLAMSHFKQGGASTGSLRKPFVRGRVSGTCSHICSAHEGLVR